MEAKIEAWRVEVERQWKAIEQDVLGHEPSGRNLAQLCEELKLLACVVAWHREQGIITRAAERRGTNRKVLRGHVKIWAQRHPRHVPERPKRPRGIYSSDEQEAKRAEAREKDNARHRARRAKLRAERAERAARDGVEATATKGTGRS
ncbi:hypothetical protein [Paraliomyxa miuraensis]|uniref:hypothetical protein n=1 Tax=Paraliomyxa miuraensis TaxID=376150 RepID=UPI00224F56B8|nr:hypothetical protein [Paraliomyxa miuraensis]MCX4239390.1 hypothetical protein [Paraliomyxa miuraensis]